MDQFQGQQGTMTIDTSQQAFQQVTQPVVMAQGLPLQFLQPGQFPAAVQGQQPQVRYH